MSSLEVEPTGASQIGADRLQCLDALRGALALFVVAYHFSAWTHAFGAGSRAASAIAVLGIYSVQGFFVISGLCFFHVYRGAAFGIREAQSFYIKRFFRIAPLYYLTLALDLALGQAVQPSFTWRRLLENVSLSFGFFHPNHSMVLGGWSIGIECVFYVAFPALLWLCRTRGTLYAWTLVLALAAVWTDGELERVPEASRFHAYVQIPNHAFLFMLGGVLADLRARFSLRIPAFGLLPLLTLALWALWRQLDPVFDHFALMKGSPRVLGVGACVLVVWLAALGVVRGRRWFAPFRVLGDLSYATYLLHPFAWLVLERLHFHASRPGLAFGGGIALTLLLAGLVHVALERPLLRWGKTLAQGSERTGAAAKAAAASTPPQRT